jgi:hypothetical protein
MSAPLCGISYALAGTAGFLWGFRRRQPLQAAGIVILFVAAINTYSEEWGILRKYDVALPLLVGFLSAYTVLSLRLMRQVGITKRRSAIAHSFLPVVYALAVSFAFFLPDIMKTDENPPLTLYVYLLLILAIHVPAFAFGRSRAIQSGLASSATSLGSNPQTYFSYLWKPLLVLGAPLLVCLVIQAARQDDWRLFGSNLVITIVLALLFLIARPGSAFGQVAQP